MSVVNTRVADKHLDEKNWVSLMVVARKLGISKEEVRQFFRERKDEEEYKKLN